MCSLRLFVLLLSITVLVVAYLLNLSISNENYEISLVQEWAEKNKLILQENIKGESFKIKFDLNEWNLLKNKLENTRYFDQLDENNDKKFDFGFGVSYAKELVNYWKTDFDWKQMVDVLNKFEHYKIDLDGYNVHYIRVNNYKQLDKSARSKKIPLLLINGWPGSFYEFYNLIDLINTKFNNNKRHFDIIIPSIPGFGYSVPLNRKIDTIDTARLFDALMRHLFNDDCKYYVHGEDFGSIIATYIAKLYPSRVAGLHLTLPASALRPNLKSFLIHTMYALWPNYILTPEEQKTGYDFSLFSRFKVVLKEAGYMHLQATRPDTVGFGLTDSPVGLMAYILEKFSSWSYPRDEILKSENGCLEKFSKNDLLTIVTLYWMTNTITTSMRYYKCSIDAFTGEWPKNVLIKIPIDERVPIAIPYFPDEIIHEPLVLLKEIYRNITQYNIYSSGGHFSAFQKPDILINDLIKFIDSIERD